MKEPSLQTSRKEALVVRNLAVPVLVAVVAFIFWDSALLYPLKILVVLFHELSHGLAAWVTGGSIEQIEISFDQGGLCTTRGGWFFLILNAGYLGSLAWGVVFLIVAARTRHDRLAVGLVGTILILVTLVYIRSLFGFVYGILTGAVLLGIAAKLSNKVSDLLLTIIGTVSCLYAVWDIGSDVIFRHIPGSDAHRLGELTGIPSVVWGVVWIVVSVGITIEALGMVSRRTREAPSKL